jgi:carbon storage regulator
MLVLSRKLGEIIILGADIKVQVLSVDRGRVRLGFTAPPGVSILREEIAGMAKIVAHEHDLGGEGGSA